ncbi:metallophosphoesterase [Shewanella sp. VB17]|uniref:metallophosphoesterase n=1 Tax=Shewanella sp. VB17 TaxID=2739432 RepID=UPI0015646A46|nr:metallophosphoesterase [Shewanella sp. VB17]NRD74333.1 metallophosphoesterase [Shewanella sp. VB17]
MKLTRLALLLVVTTSSLTSTHVLANTVKSTPMTRLLFTADPQFYTKRSDINDPTLDKLSGVISELRVSQNSPNPILGLLVGGDMTQTAHDTSITGWEFRFWKDIIKYYGVTNKAYETIGNHDETTGGASAPKDIIKFIDRNRQYSRQSYRRTGALYSWNVNDIHFVALGTGVFSSENPTVFGDVKNSNQLDFLQNDLDLNVGNSQKKVVLMFHMPANHNDWKLADRNRFLNLIQEYNIVLLLTGHTHSWGGETFVSLPNGRRIPQVTAPTLRADQKPLGQYTDIKFRNQSGPAIEVELKHNNGTTKYKGTQNLNLQTDRLWYPGISAYQEPNYKTEYTSWNGKNIATKGVHYYNFTNYSTNRCITYNELIPQTGTRLVQGNCNITDQRSLWFWSANTHQIHSKLDWDLCWTYAGNYQGAAITLEQCRDNDSDQRFKYIKKHTDMDWVRYIQAEDDSRYQVDGYANGNTIALYNTHQGNTQTWGVSHVRYPANALSYAKDSMPRHQDQ